MLGSFCVSRILMSTSDSIKSSSMCFILLEVFGTTTDEIDDNSSGLIHILAVSEGRASFIEKLSCLKREIIVFLQQSDVFV